ncbi:hypothetical protein PCYB_008220 [Plasmodium cynomolgi strain B]|uniref:CYIR protein n=1 Tax=Plasmodium cynomolgi (strain B) TaxID=1120755 RepID=K6UP43_PLACD|nr:hypothetical protein PCYB_008220 [Plasmodium cynomolgi strain B]GAB70073.1 hypothetical protein PCYB_008220 [Plasmodium cynomolgi strain B]
MSTETEDTYYSYNDYCFYKKIFDDAHYYSKKESVNKDNIIIKSIHSKFRDRFIKLCATIKDYLSHSDIKHLSDITNTCKYINYHIRSDIKNHMYYDINDNSNNFKRYFQFDDEFKNNSCISKINYIDDITFNKMNKLYDLYDAYAAYCDYRNYESVQDNCETLGDVFDDYNDIIKSNKYANSIYLYKELKNIKCLIERDHLIYSGKCDSKLIEFASPEVPALEYEKTM